jgi:hypothetical protein
LEEDVPQRVAPAVFGTLQRREFPGEQTVRFCSGGIQNSAERGISWGANCQVFDPAVLEKAEHHVYSSIVLRIFL